MQSVIEHIVDLNAFMAGISQRASQGAILYVNGLTPDLITASRRANSFIKAHFIEHINYFTVASLDRLMARHGFAAAPRVVLTVDNRRLKAPRLLADLYQRFWVRNGCFERFYVRQGSLA